MNARETILAAVRKTSATRAPRPAYAPPAFANLAETFTMRARESHASVHELASPADVPAMIATIVGRRNDGRRLHLPEGSPLRKLDWSTAPLLEITADPPTGEDTACAEADCGIAETGTIAFISGEARPSSWHFLPGREIIVLARANLVGTLEEFLTRMGTMPSTLNLVTGPSRTGDIEQAMERGAHGPREIHILLLP